MRENRSEYVANQHIIPGPSPLLQKAKAKSNNPLRYAIIGGLVWFVLFGTSPVCGLFVV